MPCVHFVMPQGDDDHAYDDDAPNKYIQRLGALIITDSFISITYDKMIFKISEQINSVGLHIAVYGEIIQECTKNKNRNNHLLR